MKYGLVWSIGLALTTSALSSAASAVPLVFDFSGPSGTAVFQLDSNPTPDFSSTFLGSDQFGFNNVAGVFGGSVGTASVISFGTGLFPSFSLAAPNLGFTQFIAPTLFTGTRTMPVFAPGTFTLVNPFFGNGTLDVSAVQGAIPEPGTWALLLVGFGTIGAGLRFRRRGTAVPSA